MITISQRPLTDAERALLVRLASKHRGLGNVVAGAGCVTMVILAPAVWILKWLALERWQPLAGLVALIAGIATAFRMRRAYWGGGQGPRVYAEDLADGQAQEITYEVLDAIEVKEYEDLGSNYYLRLADGSIVFVTGQYLYDDEMERRFPNTRIRRTIAPRSQVLLDFACLGTNFAPSSTRPAFSVQEYKARRVPTDGAIVEVDFESLRRGAA